jgi:hypothetical protein
MRIRTSAFGQTFAASNAVRQAFLGSMPRYTYVKSCRPNATRVLPYIA